MPPTQPDSVPRSTGRRANLQRFVSRRLFLHYARQARFVGRVSGVLALAASGTACGPRAHIPSRPAPVAVAASEAQVRTARALAPVLYLQRDERFELARVVAVVHPERPIVAYHLLWRDDVHGAWIPFTDATDQEVVWVGHDSAGRPREVWTYWHGRILHRRWPADSGVGPGPADGLRTGTMPADGRVGIDVQWGKHGSIPRGYPYAELPAFRGMTSFYVLHWIGLPDIWLGNAMRRGPWCFCHGYGRYRDFSRPLALADRLDAIVATARPDSALEAAFGGGYAGKTRWP